MGPQDAPGTTGTSAIDAARRLLADFSRCPACASVLLGNRCPACGVDLTGAHARRVGELSVRAGQLLSEREAVIAAMRAEIPSPTRSDLAPVGLAPVGLAPVGLAPAGLAPVGPASVGLAPVGPRVAGPVPVGSTPASSGLGVHGLLVGLGALLLSVAAVGFLVFSWRVLALPERAAVIATATLGVLATASWLRGRLPETAEAVGGLGVVLVLADSWAIRRTGLFGADRPDGLEYAAAALAICALLLGGWALISRVRAGSWAAVTLAPLAVLLLSVRLSGEFGPVPVLAAGALLVAGLALGRVLLPLRWQAERWLLRGIAGAALLFAGVSAGAGLPGPGRAAIVLVGAAMVAALGAWADRPQAVPRPATSLLLRRSWSLTAGLFAGAAAGQAGQAVVAGLDLDGVTALIPLTALPALAVLAAAVLRTRSGGTLRRTAFGAGTVTVAAVVGVQLIGLAGWLPLRAALAGTRAWSASPGDRFGDLDPQWSATTTGWLVALIGLSVLGGCGLLAVRFSGWPVWLRRPVRIGAVTAGGLIVLVLPLSPGAPVAAVVAALAGFSVLLAVLVAGPPARAARSRTWLIAGWTASALTGTLAVVLAWCSRDLSVLLTGIGIVALLLARRRVPVTAGDHTAARQRAGLAGLAGAAAPFAVAAGAGIAGAPPSQRVVWAGLVGGLSVAALIGLGRWVPTARPGRAGWTGVDRLAAATPGLAALLLGLLATLPDGLDPAVGGAYWPRPALLAVALLIALTGTVGSRPAIARAVPILPAACAVALAPLLGSLAAALRAEVLAAQPVAAGGPALSLLWAVAAALAALAVSAAVLSGRADPARRVAAELGGLLTGLISLTLVDDSGALWVVLLVLGAGSVAIAATEDRRRIGWLAGVLLTGSTWTRLAIGDVDLVEAYTLPPALALLGLALYRFRRDRSSDPVRALIPVATVGLAPSILVAGGGSALRPGGLIAIAAVLALAGWRLNRRRPAAASESGVPTDLGLGSPRGVVLAGIGVLTAGAVAIVRAGSALDSTSGANPLALSELEQWTLPAAGILLFAALGGVGARQLPAGRRSTVVASAASPSVLAAVLLAGIPTLLAATGGAMAAGGGQSAVARAVAVLGLAVAAMALAGADRLGSNRFSRARSGLEPGALFLAIAAAWTGLTLEVGPAEVWTLPVAVAMLGQGWSRFDSIAVPGARPGGLAPSWTAYGPGVAGLLLPSLGLSLFRGDESPLRAMLVIALAGGTLVIGAIGRLQAPVLLGAGVVAGQAVVLLVPWIAAVSAAVPLWGWLAVVGLGLILLGARYEARMRQLRMIRLRLAALR